MIELVCRIHAGEKPTLSQRTSMMVFGAKPRKPASTKPSDKRKISLLNRDFTLITGVEALRFKKLTTHTLSNHQLASGSNRRIYHGINRIRDLIQTSRRHKGGYGVLDNDYRCTFDLMLMNWVYLVMLAKGVDERVVEWLKNLYRDIIQKNSSIS